MRYIGLYRELDPRQPDLYQESIHEAIARGATYSMEEVAKYLEAGHPTLDVMEGTPDVVGGAFSALGGPSMMTDGEYAWRYDLSFYVRHYTPALPEEFTARVHELNGVVPQVPHEKLLLVSSAINEYLGFRKSEPDRYRRGGQPR
ncbi:hypothetical protein ACL02R_27295 [Streptomyces sp. MS19]|uniref:hypothetical protein n=1 Tax=Streptomyces sp. MS19 TaxID=3385972 RepID=UPI0039A2F930